MDPLYQHLARHPVDVQPFPEPILHMAGIAERWARSLSKPVIMRNGKKMAFRNFVVVGNDKDMSFIVKSKNEERLKIGSLSLVKNTADSDDPNTGEKHTLVAGSSRIGDRVRNRKGQGSSQARPSSKREIQLSTPPARTTRQKVTMLHAELSQGKASALETLKVFDDDQDLHGLPSTKELPDALAYHIMVEQVTPGEDFGSS
ncbi:hypothetical protein Tco_1284250 [Tanacetum coccineum]